MSIQGNYLGMSLSIDDLDKENLSLLRALRPSRVPFAEVRRLRITAVSAYDRLSLVRQPTGDLDGCRGQGRRAFLRGSASRDPASVQNPHAVYGPAGGPRYPEGSAVGI